MAIMPDSELLLLETTSDDGGEVVAPRNTRTVAKGAVVVVAGLCVAVAISTWMRTTAAKASVADAVGLESLAMPMCQDAPGWTNGFTECKKKGYNGVGCTETGLTCEAYVSNGWCAAGHVVAGKEWTTGKKFQHPEKNCCACGLKQAAGGLSKRAPVATPAPAVAAAPATEAPVAPAVVSTPAPPVTPVLPVAPLAPVAPAVLATPAPPVTPVLPVAPLATVAPPVEPAQPIVPAAPVAPLLPALNTAVPLPSVEAPGHRVKRERDSSESTPAPTPVAAKELPAAPAAGDEVPAVPAALPVTPVAPKRVGPLGMPTACSAYVMCAIRQTEGPCCPNEDGVRLACCSSALV